MPQKFLHDLPHIREGLDHLLTNDRVFKKSGLTLHDFPWPYMRPGFAGLARIVLGQQVSVGSAKAIWERVTARLGRVTPEKILALTDDDFRGLGMTRQKTAYLRGLAEAATGGILDLKKLDKLEDASIHTALVVHKGLGPWSVHMYLMFALGRPDIWAPGDLGIREGMRRYLKRDERPSEAETIRLGQRFAPHRTAASLLLWRLPI